MTNRWLPVVGGLCMNLALGSLYAWSVFVAPLEKEFGWTRAQTSWVFTIAVVCFAVTFVIAGQIQDRKGPRICALLGGLLVSGGFMLASQASSLMTLYIYFGVIVGIGNGFGYATPTPVGSKWFPDKRGLIIGLLVGGYGAGSAIIAPLAERQLLPAFGWRTTFQLLGAAFFVMTMIGTALLKNPPAGYRPPNWTPAAAAVTRKDMTAGEMVQTPTFYALWLAYACGTTGGLMTISQLAPFAKSAAIDTSAIFWITAIGNAGGRILSGWMSDTLGRVRTLQTMILLSALAMPALFLWRGYAMAFYALAALVYWCYGTQLSVFASTTADFYGTRNLGMNYGVLFSAWGVAGILGPAIAGRVYTSFGDYRYAFYSAAALALVGLISLTVAKAPTPKGVPT